MRNCTEIPSGIDCVCCLRFPGFLQLMMGTLFNSDSRSDMREAFNTFDTDKSGAISAAEVPPGPVSQSVLPRWVWGRYLGRSKEQRCGISAALFASTTCDSHTPDYCRA